MTPWGEWGCSGELGWPWGKLGVAPWGKWLAEGVGGNPMEELG